MYVSVYVQLLAGGRTGRSPHVHTHVAVGGVTGLTLPTGNAGGVRPLGPRYVCRALELGVRVVDPAIHDQLLWRITCRPGSLQLIL